MRKLDALKARARKAARAGGHKLGNFTNQHGADLKRPVKSTAACKQCGASVTVSPRPLPNEANIAGRAVAADCPKNKPDT